MDQKVIAIGIVVILALAAVGGGVLLVSNSNNDNNNNNNSDYEVPDVSGKWNLAYIERAKLFDADQKPILDPTKVEITERHVNPYESKSYLVVSDVGDHGFTGKFKVEQEDEIAGTLNGPAIRFVIEKSGYLYKFEGVAKQGDYLSGTMTVIKLATGTDSSSIVYGLDYMLFIRDGANPVPIRSDYVNMSIMKAGIHIKSEAHKVEDFTTGGKTGSGTLIDSTLEFVDAHSMISIFAMKKEGNVVGVQAVVSMGVTPSGTASGVIAGNIKSPLVEGDNWTFTGNMMMSKGKATFLHHIYPDSTGSHPSFVEIDYNVPYNNGGKMVPVYLFDDKPYVGTLTIKSEGKDPIIEPIERVFKVCDNTFYSEFVVNGKNVVWFGEIYGHLLDLHVFVDSNEGGHITGHVDRDGNIHLYGILMDISTNTPSFVDITLELKKA